MPAGWIKRRNAALAKRRALRKVKPVDPFATHAPEYIHPGTMAPTQVYPGGRRPVEQRVSPEEKVTITEKALADVEAATAALVVEKQKIQESKPVTKVLEEQEVKATSKPKRKRTTRAKTTKSKPTRRSTGRRPSDGSKRAKNKADK